MRITRSLLAAGAVAGTLACQDAGPMASGGPGIAQLSVRVAPLPAYAAVPGLIIEEVTATLLRPVPANESYDTVITRTAPFGINASSVNLNLSVLVGTAPDTLLLALDYKTATGRVLFVASEQVVLRAGAPSVPPALQPFYVGPGGNVAAIAIQPRNPAVVAGDTLPLTYAAVDGQQLPVDSVYVSWTASAGRVNALGTFRAPSAAGSVLIHARTPNGVQDSVLVTVLAAGAGAITGLVVDGATGAPLPNATVTVFDAQDAQVATVQTASDGSYSTPALQPGVYRVVVTLNGFVGTTLYDAQLSGGGASTVPVIPLVTASGATGGLGGFVKNATNNQPIIGAVVELRSGVNAITGTSIAATTSDTLGFYRFGNLPVGTYTVRATATGFASGARTSIVLGGATSSADDVVLSPVGLGAVRVVLTWGATPADLDAHLTGPDSTTGTRFHVYFGDQGSLTTRPYASLDVDNTSGFGPETITLGQQFPGVYRYSVHDYENSDDTTTARFLAASGARVELYIDGLLVRSFFAPNAAGTLWTVFELNGTTVRPINTMTFEPNSSDVNLRAGTTAPASDAEVIRRDGAQHPKRAAPRSQ